MTETEIVAPVERARQVILEEACALRAMADKLTPAFAEAVRTILGGSGRLVLTGMGKHGLIARKIAATLASTGTPAFYMHPGEALHGDLGMITPEDIILALSNSGTTEEIVSCLPFFRRNGNVLIAMTGNPGSALAKAAAVVLDIGVDREVCPLNLAPTTSTTAALAMGDALAVVLLEQRGFQPSDFALRHPNGALGRQFKRVGDLMRAGSNPAISGDAAFLEAVAAITAHRHGAVSVTDGEGRLIGILTDGDVRRVLQREGERPDRSLAEITGQAVSNFMTPNPLTVPQSLLATQALGLMEDGPRKVLVLPVVDEEQRPVGMIHLHDIVGG